MIWGWTPPKATKPKTPKGADEIRNPFEGDAEFEGLGWQEKAERLEPVSDSFQETARAFLAALEEEFPQLKVRPSQKEKVCDPETSAVDVLVSEEVVALRALSPKSSLKQVADRMAEIEETMVKEFGIDIGDNTYPQAS